MPIKIENDEQLGGHLAAIAAGAANSKSALGWYRELESFLNAVELAIPGKLTEIDFLSDLWDNESVASTGMGSVRMAPALENEEFRLWFSSEVGKPLPSDPVATETRLVDIYDELQSRLQNLCGRTPRLKINRVLCAIYPEHFTTIADVGALRVLFRVMGGRTNEHPVRMHREIRQRMDQVLGPVVEQSMSSKVRRMCLPWYLYERLTEDEGTKPETVLAAPSSSLNPLPATLRRKGLTSIKGGFQTLLGLLPELKEGITRQEFESLILQINPNLTSGSVGTAINVISREFDICKREGDVYQLSARGLNLLDTQDPEELADHLMTKILGVDNVLKKLQFEPQSKAQLVTFLQGINPGWTSEFAPQALLSWLGNLGVIELNKARCFELSERGRRWAEMVTWAPQSLPKVAETIEEFKESSESVLELPSIKVLLERLKLITSGKLMLDDGLVGQLHGGLWFHPVRHFAILTGISGSGKTQLALNYALALCDVPDGDHNQVKVIPVQPGWYDPSPLLGYVNPIQDTSYRSAPFLELMQRAAGDPDRPYVAILDEMNLSHPEQYLAPILSAMETHDWIELHTLGREDTPVEPRIRYPANLAIIGTVNMDETTHGLSDKVLDRAYTLEFWKIAVEDFPGWRTSSLEEGQKERTKAVLEQMVKALEPVRLHFGWRTIDDVLSFLEFQMEQGAGAIDVALDNVIYAKVLPKLRGEGSRFGKSLEEVFKICLANDLTRCAGKVKSMQNDFADSGSARYWR